jgi:hypothetical protein
VLGARAITVAVTMVFVAIFLSFLYLGARRAVRLTGHRDMDLLFIAAMAEIAAFLAFLYYFYSYTDDFNNARIHVVIIEHETSLVNEYPSLEAFIEQHQQLQEDRSKLRSELYERRKRHLGLVAKDFGSAIERVRKLLQLRRRSREKGLGAGSQDVEEVDGKAKTA